LEFLLEHQLPKKLRYAKVYFEAGPTSVFFSLNGTNEDWHATIGMPKDVEMTDVEYSRLRAEMPAVELLEDDGRKVLIRNAEGNEELWEKLRWVLARVHKRPSPKD
jgi:hypothetical protein